MTETRKPLLSFTAYLPFGFVVSLFQPKEDPELLWHTKNGAAYTALFIVIALFASVMSMVFYFGAIAALLFGIYFAASLLTAYNAVKGVKVLTPFLSAKAQSIPLEKFIQKPAAKAEVTAPSVEQTPVAPVAPAPAPVEAAPMAAPVANVASAPMPEAPVQAAPVVNPEPLSAPVNPEPPQAIQ